MIEEVVSVELPVHERLVVRKNRLMNKDENHSTPRISIVTGTHGDELDGQLICYEIIRRIEREKDKLKGIVDIYPDINPLGIDTGSRGIPMFDLDMNRVFPGDNNGAMAEYVAAGIIEDIIGSDLCIDIHSSNIFVNEMPQVELMMIRRKSCLHSLYGYIHLLLYLMQLLHTVLIILVCLLLLQRWELGTELHLSTAGILLMVYLTLCRIWEYGMMSQRMLMTLLSLQKVKLHFLLLRKAEYSYQQLILWEGLELERI